MRAKNLLYYFLFFCFITIANSSLAQSPNVSFTVNNTSQCLIGNSFSFNNTSTGILTYNWDFGDSTYATNTNVTKVYTIAKDYNVTLIATDTAGIKYYYSQKVTVNPLPQMSFNVLPGAITGTSYNFISTSSVTSGYIASYQWNFGDGTTATGTNPYKSYSAIGTYNITLTGTTNAGCTNSITTPVTINISNVANAPAAFTVNTINQCFTNNNYVFTNTTPVNGNEIYLWEFGDGTTATTQNAQKNYTAAGLYIVKLTIIRNSDTSRASQQVSVYPKPTVSFTALSSQSEGKSFSFLSTSSVAFGTPTYFWNFGDGTTSTLSNPTKLYATMGSYNVKLVVTNTTGCADSSTQTITTCPSITAGFNATSTNGICTYNNSYSFTNTSSASSGTTSYDWNFGDGTTYSGTTPPAKSYSIFGDYVVKMVATNTNGFCVIKDSTTQYITIYPKPKVDYILYLNTELQTLNIADTLKKCFNNGNDFSFISTSSIGRGTMLYKWDFGTTAITYRDGNDTFVNPRIIFQTDGLYPVKLKVTSLEGCTDSITYYFKLVTPPIPSFISVINYSTPDSLYIPAVQLNNTTVYNGVSTIHYEWSDGGYNSATLYNTNSWNPTYTRGGNYNITLKAVADGIAGCANSVSNNIQIYIKPSAVFNIASYEYDANRNPVLTFNNTSSVTETSPSLSYLWNFGDGTTSNTANPTHTYTSANGTTNVTLTVTNNNGGLQNSVTHTSFIAAKPTAIIGVHIDTVITAGGTTYYIHPKNLSTITSGNIAMANWTYTIQSPIGTIALTYASGNILPGTLPTPIAISASSSYQITINLTATSNLGITNTTIAIVGSSTNSGYTTFNNIPISGSLPTVLSVNNKTTALTTVPLTIYPNPAQSFINVNFAPGSTQFATINIYTTTGVLIKSQKETISNIIYHNAKVNVSSLQKGNYVIEITDATLNKIGTALLIKE
ncbi:MAG: PKD domain-containing protein [Bacteroidetes bacterium]|nr:PKD domain-containing protein [Bacteroidota bacterium]MBS1648181.1 PKD domain-containing protein [Bacteroidota bacterium]